MMTSRRIYVCVLLALVVCSHEVVGGQIPLHRRQDGSPSTTARADETNIGPGDATSPSTTSETFPTIDIISGTISSLPPAMTSSDFSAGLPSNSSIFDDLTLPPDQLPIEPRLTPGWGVAGAILLITGLVYCLVGIKNTLLHTFLSAAYLSGLSITVLILYVMVPPISDGIQGAYVVAAIVPALIIGASAMFFREIAEGLGCLLGGFCFAMWVLTLQSGGLVDTTAGKVIFIIAFSLGSFAFYFSHWTRAYAMIGLMALAGATVTVMGIDCFSKAGYKEFWAYVWNLNGQLFPLGAESYPVTKGIKVELAVVVVLTFAGVISQLKLWKVIQEHRLKRAASFAEEQRIRQEEEAVTGRQVEEQNARELRQWDAAYGERPPGSSVVSETDDEKKNRHSRTTIKRVSSSSGQAGSSSPMPTPDEKAWMGGADGGSQRSLLILPHNVQQIVGAGDPQIVAVPAQITEMPAAAAADVDVRSSAASVDEDDVLSKRASKGSLVNRLSIGSNNILRSLSQRSHRSQNDKRRTEEEAIRLQQMGKSTEGLVNEEWRDSKSDVQSVNATFDGMSTADNDMSLVHDEGLRQSLELTNSRLEANEISITGIAVDDQESDESKTTVRVQQLRTRHGSMADLIAGSERSIPLKKESDMNVTADVGGGPVDESASPIPSETPKAPKSLAPSIASSSHGSLTKDRLPEALSKVAMSYRTNEWAKHLSLAEAPELEGLQLNGDPDTCKQENGEEVKGDGPEKVDEEKPVPVNIEDLQQTPQSGGVRRVISTNTIQRSSSAMSTTAGVPIMPIPSVHPSTSKVSLHRSSSTPVPLVITIPPSRDGPTGNSQISPIKRQSLQSSPPSAGAPISLRSSTYRRQSGTPVIHEPILEETGGEQSQLPIKRLSISPNGSGGPPGTPTSDPNSNSAASSIRAAALDNDQEPVTDQLSNANNKNRPAVLGLVSYSSPQTLLGKREMYLRSRSSGAFYTPGGTTPGTPDVVLQQQYLGPDGSMMSSPFATPTTTPPDDDGTYDDIPLSQRKELIRRTSMLSVHSATSRGGGDGALHRSMSRASSNPDASANQMPVSIPQVTAHDAPFNSHQPQHRQSKVFSDAQREARLANFRQSVAVDLRAGTPVNGPIGNTYSSNNNGRQTPLQLLTSANPGLGASTNSLLLQQHHRGSNDVGRAIDQQRQMLLSQREQEAQRREVERAEKERSDRALEQMMRRGDMMDAHRDAMRRLQGRVKDA